MVAYNFQKQFVEPIRSGNKTHTIRRNGKRRHALVGEAVQLYTGMRTASCEKILAKDPTCISTSKVKIRVHVDSITAIHVGGVRVVDKEEFAIADGFASLDAMHEFWLKFHGVGMFEGTLIEWREAC